MELRNLFELLVTHLHQFLIEAEEWGLSFEVSLIVQLVLGRWLSWFSQAGLSGQQWLQLGP